MLNFIKRQLGLSSKQRNSSPWYPISQAPNGFFSPYRSGDYRHATTREANSLSPVYAAKDLYKRSLALCPLITFKKGADGGRDRATTHPAYKILHDLPNPAMNRITFFEKLVDDYFTHGEFVAIISWKGNNNVHGLYPVPHGCVVDVKLEVVEDEWRKVFTIREDSGEVKLYDDADVIHIIKDSECGIRGRSILCFAAESFGLHRQILESANAYFKNAVNPSVYVNQTGQYVGGLEARQKEQAEFEKNFGGTRNAGKVPFVANSTIEAFPSTTAEEANLIEAMNSSVADVARWFGVSPLLLGDLTKGTYSNLAADNASFVQKSLQPLMEKIQLEFNVKLFGADASTYAEFETKGILRGDPAQEQQIINGYLQSGVMTRAEARELLNLPPLEGADVALVPTNQAVVTGAADSQPLTQESVNVNTTQPSTI